MESSLQAKQVMYGSVAPNRAHEIDEAVEELRYSLAPLVQGELLYSRFIYYLAVKQSLQNPGDPQIYQDVQKHIALVKLSSDQLMNAVAPRATDR